MAAPTVIINPVISTDGTTNRVDFSKDLIMDYESESPLLTLITKMKDEKTNNVEFKHAVGRRAPRYSATTSAVTAGAAGVVKTVPVTNGEYFVKGDVVECSETNVTTGVTTNQLYVSAVSSDNLTCYPYDSTLGICAIDSGDTIRRVAPATPEAWAGSDPQMTEPTVYTDYCQSFENSFSLSRIQDTTWQYTHPERTRLREEARQKHVVDQETAFWLMNKVKDVTVPGATTPRYQLTGLVSQIATNYQHYEVTLDENELFDLMTQVHRPAYSAGSKRLVFASLDWLSSINKIAKTNSSFRMESAGQQTWGPSITRLQFSGFTWDLVTTPALSENRPGMAVICAPRYLKKRTFYPTTYEMHIESPSATYMQDRFYTVAGLQVDLEEAFGVSTH